MTSRGSRGPAWRAGLLEAQRVEWKLLQHGESWLQSTLPSPSLHVSSSGAGMKSRGYWDCDLGFWVKYWS